MRWRQYKGDRIAAPGHRTFVELAPTIRFGNSRKRYGYVWGGEGLFHAYVEVHHPGQVEDLELGTFDSTGKARRAAEAALMRLETPSEP